MDYKKLVFVLNKIGIALTSETNLEKLLDIVVNEIIQFAHCDACSLYLKEENPERLIFKIAETLSLQKKSQKFKSFPMPLVKKSIAGFVAITGNAQNIEDCYEIPETYEYSFNKAFDLDNNYRTKSMLAVPMKTSDGKILGVIQLINHIDNDTNKSIPFSKELEPIILSLASQAAVAISNAKLLAANKSLYKALVESFSEAIEARSPHTAGHSFRVSLLSLLLAKHINEKEDGKYKDIVFSIEQLEELKYAALLHDVGKVSVSEKILEKANKMSDEEIAVIKERFESIKFSIFLTNNENNDLKSQLVFEINEDLEFILKKNIPGFLQDEDVLKLEQIAAKTYADINNENKKYLTEKELSLLKIKKGSFTADEMKQMQNHVVYTADILRPIPFTDELINIPNFASKHHEMLNGTGYPNQLTAEDLPLQARILAVSDIFDALTSKDRPYKKAIPLEKSISILQSEAKNGRLDNNIVDLFIKDEIYKEYFAEIKK